jgi:hypothetical protein
MRDKGNLENDCSPSFLSLLDEKYDEKTGIKRLQKMTQHA